MKMRSFKRDKELRQNSNSTVNLTLQKRKGSEVQSDLPLREVYDVLLKMFANAPESVKTSFYSHLCALSLI